VSIATRTGDDGTTGLLHGRRLPKTAPRIEAIGTLDELSAALGAAVALLPADDSRRAACAAFQDDLSALMAELAAWPDAAPVAVSTPSPEPLACLDARVTELEAEGIVFRAWNLRGFAPGAAQLELARAVCRRA
jgi:cob(I)alamin adenosyltransferase